MRSNPYPKNATGHRKWEWLNIRKLKATYVGRIGQIDACGSDHVHKYYGRYYCSWCGARLNKEEVERRLNEQN